MLQDLVTRLTLPGLPEWTGLVALLVVLVLALCLLVMPFSVFGLKGRLDNIEAQLDDLRAELRALAIRLPEARRPDWRGTNERDIPLPLPAEPEPAPLPEQHPSIFPSGRAEPKISWPKH
ncbi:hypothetical protein [Roseococcus pinisoli]|uniref:Uncharacterized protein n=1 Tax=Roseococcus pinisoli TaxID=2835040 RepID=A0ABS5QIQ5_9PROT|nr:hypothetical protein [Roseococcus pinisoli]MBS7813571.1 hypothetical protein [Roseococcus pinisoli]